MRQNRRTPDEVALVGVQETSFAGLAKGGFGMDSKSERSRMARGWEIKFRTHPKRWREYTVNITNGVVFVAFFGYAAQGNCLYALLEAELKGAVAALEWLRHEHGGVPAEIRFTAAAFSVFLGESPCPRELTSLLDKARRAYITSADGIRIDRERHALTAEQGRKAA